MYGDTRVMRRRVDQLREQGVDLRSLADVLVGQAERVAWHGRAADAMRERIRDRARHLRDSAARHESAAESLERHLQDVDGLQDAIAHAERRALRRAEAEPHPAGFHAPPSGHRDWLTIELSGH